MWVNRLSWAMVTGLVVLLGPVTVELRSAQVSAQALPAPDANPEIDRVLEKCREHLKTGQYQAAVMVCQEALKQ